MKPFLVLSSALCLILTAAAANADPAGETVHFRAALGFDICAPTADGGRICKSTPSNTLPFALTLQPVAWNVEQGQIDLRSSQSGLDYDATVYVVKYKLDDKPRPIYSLCVILAVQGSSDFLGFANTPLMESLNEVSLYGDTTSRGATTVRPWVGLGPDQLPGL